MQYESIAARLAANSRPARKSHPTLGCPCRLWTGNVNNSGYPRFSQRVDGKVVKVYAHRTALELATGEPIPAGFDADHLCVQQRCIEGRHLEAVPAAINQQRRIERRRAAKLAAAAAKRSH